jgi:hypothetical protein
MGAGGWWCAQLPLLYALFRQQPLRLAGRERDRVMLSVFLRCVFRCEVLTYPNNIGGRKRKAEHDDPDEEGEEKEEEEEDTEKSTTTIKEFEYCEDGVMCPSSFDDFRATTLASHLKLAGGLLAEKYQRPALRGAEAKCTRLWYMGDGGEPVEIRDGVGWLRGAAQRRITVWGTLKLSESKRRALRAELAREDPDFYNKNQATQAHGIGQLQAALLDSVRTLLSHARCRAPEGGTDVYGVRVETGKVICPCGKTMKTHSNRMHSATNCRGHFYRCPDLSKKIPLPLKQHFAAELMKAKEAIKKRNSRRDKGMSAEEIARSSKFFAEKGFKRE